MITKSRNLLIGFLLMIAMLLGMFAITPQTASAATINAVWWTNASDMTDFTVSFDSTWISSSGWYKLYKYNEASEKYDYLSGSSGYVGTNTQLDFEEAIRRSGNGKYKVKIEALLQIVENRFAPRRPTLIQRGILGSPAAGWAPRRCWVA